jgi:transglutaminase/protease-like cytokinesis protein 3
MKKIIFISLIPLIYLFSTNVIGQEVNSDSLYEIALNAPFDEETDSYDLFEFFEGKVETQRDLVLLFVYWISENIAYDVEKYLSGDMSYTNVSLTLETRKTMCQGYSELFCELCEWADIECEIVKGYVKGFGYDGKPINEVNHLWNAVQIDEKWELVDLTWASGIIKGKGRPLFEKKFRSEFVFPNPDIFILTHLPVEQQWQLLEDPLTQKEFFSKKQDRKRIKAITVYE